MYLYNMRSAGTGYTITKFDADLNPLHTYTMASPTECTCPQATNRQAWCRHNDMARRFLGLDRVDSEWFYCYETGKWYEGVDMVLSSGTKLVRLLGQ
jgi:hypothetical protein